MDETLGACSQPSSQRGGRLIDWHGMVGWSARALGLRLASPCLVTHPLTRPCALKAMRSPKVCLLAIKRVDPPPACQPLSIKGRRYHLE
ncbi:hypothetical protein Pcinc_038540 [Petrolisthes cinctipes]|uniref:Uncharacterized protein n=1 Tax=Petrolisthes cinctipes TaxID=88211 RepID=A0AAE1EJX9_PETCI|nr:hypothetical protein Pcinc_038540 [Petrolisthes cinctipes]